jgi:hypothetical protein
MWRWMWIFGLLFSMSLQAQKKWDGGANTSNWSDSMNWYPDGLPGPSDDIILDNSFVGEPYMVQLPAGTYTATIRSLAIQPSLGNILVELPFGNTANPGLALTGTGDVLTIYDQGVFRNASGASSGSGISISGMIRILNGGKYVHRTSRSNAGIIDQLSAQPGTEKGIFEFDIPGAAGYTVSLTGNNFGSLSFRAIAAGGIKSYSGSGTGTLTIRGDLQIDIGAQVTSTLTADIVIGGSLLVEGKLNMNPVTVGSTSRSLRFIGKSSTLRGTGPISMNAAFRNIEIAKGAALSLERSIQFPQPTHSLIINGNINLHTYVVGGPGSFILKDSSTLQTAHEFGISATTDQGNILTAQRAFSTGANYMYNGNMQQLTGDALPDTISSLGIDNSHGLILSKKTYVRDSLLLMDGKITSTMNCLLMMGVCKIRSGISRYGNSNEGSEQSYILGPLALDLVKDSLFIVPIGMDSVFAPLRLRKKDPGIEQIVVRYFLNEYHDRNILPPLMGISDKEYWQFDEPPSSLLEMGLTYRPWSLTFDPSSKLALATYSNSWVGLNSQVTGNGYGWISSDSAQAGVLALTPGMVSDPVVLPLGILEFNVREDQGKMKLSWETEEDHKNTLYEVLRSGDGRNFSVIGTVHSAGKSRALHYWDDMLPLPLNYYQLHMAAGSSDYKSRIIRKIKGQKMAGIYPNPVREELNINYPGSRSKYEVEIVSFSGIVCKKFVCNTATCRIRVSDLMKGIYLIRFKDRSGSVTLPFTKD